MVICIIVLPTGSLDRLVVISMEKYANEDVAIKTVSAGTASDDCDVDILNDSLHNLSLEGRVLFSLSRFILLCIITNIISSSFLLLSL